MLANPTLPIDLVEEELKRAIPTASIKSASEEESDAKKASELEGQEAMQHAEGEYRLSKEERDEMEREKAAAADAKLLLELQRCFLWLRAADVRFYDPTPLVKACDTLSLTYSVYHQNDAAEFCDRLVSHLEHRLASTPQAKALEQVFGGRLVSQTVRESGHVTESEAPFTFLEVAIKNKSSLLQALRTQMEGEVSQLAVPKLEFEHPMPCMCVALMAVDDGRQQGVV